MKKRYIKVAVALSLALSLTTSSCIGSFTMTNSLLNWNRSVGNKFVNELVFFAFWILPAYEISALADLLVLNTIEFWSGNNPMHASSKRVVEGTDGRYLVEQDSKGYTITGLDDKSVVRLDFDSNDNAWDLVLPETGETHRIMTFIDDTHISVPAPDGSDMLVELSQGGVFAYQQAVTESVMSRID